MSLGTPKWTVYLMKSDPYISGLCVLMNFLHLAVLTRKTMRNSSVNIIMIGISILDLFSIGYPVVKLIRLKFASMNTCQPPDSYLIVCLNWIFESLRDDTVRCTNFLGLSMAIIRVVVIRSAVQNNSWRIFQNASEPAFGCKMILCVLVFSSGVSLFYLLRQTVEVSYDWEPWMTRCLGPEWPVNYTQPFYVVLTSDSFMWNDGLLTHIYVFVDGIVSKVIPAFVFPVLTLILIGQLRQASQNRNRLFSNAHKDKSNLTTKLVTFVSFCFMISLMPLGILHIVHSLCDYECSSTVFYLMVVCQLLFPLNSISHFFLCISISSEYQNAMKSMLGLERKTTDTQIPVLEMETSQQKV